MIRATLRAAALVAALAPAGPAAAVSFARADRDGDGSVGPEEALRSLPKLGEAHFGKCDGNRDGRLDRGEFACLDALHEVIGVED